MKIKFDSSQEYQLDAINAVVDVFEGQPLAQTAYEVRLEASGAFGELKTELGMGNNPAISQGDILANVQRVQERNGLPVSNSLDGMNFSVEMETGTGKTYVYLRSLYELHARYGFRKFVVVVPSIAIREGVMKNIELTREHFQELYGNTPVDCWVYDSKQVSRLRHFAASNALQVLIINIDAFNKKDIAVIHQDNDRLSGRRPIEFVQATKPIVILDEPQNMESDTARAAIASLNPLCTFRYSATHRNLYNLLYRLDPVKAYDLRLVKQIEVDSVVETSEHNQPYIAVKSIKTRPSGPPVAKLEIDVQGKDGVSRKVVSVSRKGDDLFVISGQQERYRGYVLENVHASYGYVSFSNGVRLEHGQTHGGHTDEIMRVQIEQTVENHFEKELAVARLPEDQRMKVLSLFFIDRVANYAEQDGKIRRWFVDAYQRLAVKPAYQPLNPLPVENVHNGYFAEQNGTPKDSAEGRDTKADDEAYALIMRDKERLLSLEEPLRFIFSHSALREGWDNPNVFQICTLNETHSEIKKRQEIGRGMRLPVRVNGERCFDAVVNKLTVIANESYQEFAKRLQTEIEDECGVKFDSGRIKNKRERRKAALKKGWILDPNFLELWERIKHRTRYSVKFDTQTLVSGAVKLLKDEPPIKVPAFAVQVAEIGFAESGLQTTVVAAREERIKNDAASIPDMLGYLQKETELTRATIADILAGSGRLGEAAVNPQQFLDQALSCIRRTLHDLMVDGIKYERIEGAEYKMMLFESKELESYLSSMLEVDHSIYDYIVYESDTEKHFAEALDKRHDIKLFVKLPPWFKVDTPLGTYNPDWAIVKEQDGKVYLVRETKASTDLSQLRPTERHKIRCGKKHFDILPGVEFGWGSDPNEI